MIAYLKCSIHNLLFNKFETDISNNINQISTKNPKIFYRKFSLVTLHCYDLQGDYMQNNRMNIISIFQVNYNKSIFMYKNTQYINLLI